MEEEQSSNEEYDSMEEQYEYEISEYETFLHKKGLTEEFEAWRATEESEQEINDYFESQPDEEDDSGEDSQELTNP